MAEIEGIDRTQVPTTTQVQTQTPPTQDPQVTEAVQATIELADAHHLSDPAYTIEQTLADPSLTQAQKDEYIARLVEFSGSSGICTADGQIISAETAAKFRTAFEEIGTAYTGPATPELRSQVTDAIARGVANGRLSADDLYSLVNPATNPNSDGARQLLTGVSDGAVLNRVADRLLGDAQRLGYDINDDQIGPQALTAAADIAAMAADHGFTASASAVLAEIDRQTQAGPVADDMTLTQAMMATSLMGAYGSPIEGRTGFDALAALVDSVPNTAANQPAADRLFASLVRSRDDGYVGGLDQSGNRSGALDSLGNYFDANVARLSEQDWRAANTGGLHHGLVRDFVRHVMLDDSYGAREQTASALGAEMTRLAGIVGDESRPLAQREDAATQFGTVIGSIQSAAQDYVENARGDAEDKIDLVRNVTDLITDKLISYVPGGDLVQEGGSAFVDAAWGALADHVESQAQAHADETTGGLVTIAQTFREAMSDLPSSILNAYDYRVDHYFEPSE